MKLLTYFVLLLTLQLCAPVAQNGNGGAPDSTASGAGGAALNNATVSAAPSGHTVNGGPVVCIDPGHPSEVASGQNIQNGTSETHVAWTVAVRLRRILEAKGYTVCMTKSEEDQLVRNRDRALAANRARAALMVRLHCDASNERGFAVYYPDRQGRTKDGATGPAQQVIMTSRLAARAVHAAMSEGLRGHVKDNGVRTDFQTKIGAEQGALTGSIFSEVPVITIEMVVLSSPEDAEFIKAEEGQQRMAQAIADGIERFVESSRRQN